MTLRRADLPVAVVRFVGDAHHPRHVGAVDVDIQQPHALALLGQDRRQVAGDRGLAHAALAAVHANFRPNGGEAIRDLTFLRPLPPDLLQTGVLLSVGLLWGCHRRVALRVRASWACRAG